MATMRIPPSRSLMCAAVYDERTGQQPIVVNNNKLHIFPDWHNCYQNYQTTMVSSFGGLTLTGNGSFTDMWRSPWETTVDMSKSSRSIFAITPMMLKVMRGTFGGESKQSEFETFVNTAEKIWGVKFEYSENKSIACALCPSDAAPSGMNGDKFSGNAIKGSLCFCTKVDCEDNSDGYLNMGLKKLMLAIGRKVCYVVCEVDPKGFVEATTLSKSMMSVGQKDDSMTEAYSYCVKGLRVFVGETTPVSLKSLSERTEDGEGGYVGIQSVDIRYMTLLLNRKMNPTAYSQYYEYATIIKGDDEWDDDIQGNLPSRTPIRNYTAVKGKYWEELG